ncbi:MAG: phosphatidylserine/phosphatidylglycerophosphate/cardiolipin synthase family protein [candidate division KSB1 bacterium]|nr:phosphatidylserine/phosphatidylglycerophosphate/cardiolipin synthase family protein [candidate division KSB1 bacterium]MDZ7302884.1 phosphatidylserine/phosphatidylglycerophosphate/cardiolipin synthase family protein [candidate division KSB1 bacterium]
MPASSSRPKKVRTRVSREMRHRTSAIRTRSEKIVAFPHKDETHRDVYDRASILREASQDPEKENRALKIIRKIRSGKKLTAADQKYEIASAEELQGTLLPTLQWQYGRRQDHYRARRAPVTLDEQIDNCIELLFKSKLTLADLPADFDWCANNSIELIYNEPGHDRFFRRLFEDLKNAKQHIHIVMFGIKGKIGNEQDIAWQVAKILAEKAGAGVEVNLLIDAKGCGLTWLGRLPDGPPLMDWLRQHGVNIVVNHPLRPADLQRFLRLDHRKIYLIDGKIGYCGGMGIENQFFYDWYDVMLRMEGEIVHQLQMHFLSTFHWQGGKIAARGPSRHEIRQRYFPDLPHKVGNHKAKLLVNIPAPGKRAISESYVEALDNTQTSFYFMNPYCFTDWLVAKLQTLAEKLYKKGHIWRPGMVEPSGVVAFFPGAGYGFPMEQARTHEYEGLKSAGVGILIYPAALHGKVYIQDALLTNIGSFNIDDASLERNWETNVLIEDKEFAQYVVDELFKKQEEVAEIKVKSDLNKISIPERIKAKAADKIDFVL